MQPTRPLPIVALLAAAAILAAAPAAAQDQRPFLGIQLEQQDGRPTIATVIAGGSAQKMGLQKGDVILAFNGVATPDTRALIGQIRAAKVGDVIKVKVLRADKELELAGKLGTRPPRPTIKGKQAPPLDCAKWANLPEGAEPPTIASLKGKVVLIHCFQSW